MKVLFIGDVYGDPGLEILYNELPKLKEKYRPNIIICNAENAHNGRGVNLKIYKDLMSAGVSCLTMGNWVWGNKEIFTFIDEANICRPINYRKAPGRGVIKINYNGKSIAIINAMGRTYMTTSLDNPFLVIEETLKTLDTDYVVVDFHAEATSEKVALGHYLDGKVDAVIGSHTHIQTSDEKILPKGTLYITDAGMTGAMYGIIGVEKEIVINRFLDNYAGGNVVAKGRKELNAVYMDLDSKTIERIHLERD